LGIGDSEEFGENRATFNELMAICKAAAWKTCHTASIDAGGVLSR
jgi:hypothetical protein